MRKLLSLFLALILLLTGCMSPSQQSSHTSNVEGGSGTTVQTEGASASNTDYITDLHYLEDNPEEIVEGDSKSAPKELSFSRLSDPGLIDYVEQNVFSDLSALLDTEYRVESVSATYISKEYIEELAYNSQINVFFGYSLKDLDAQFQGTRYVFTLDDFSETVVVPLEKYDDTYERVIKNVAIGTGVILLCVTVSVVSGGAGAPAVSMIFAASAKTGSIFALSSGAISTGCAGIMKYMETGDLDESLKEGALAGSESFKWGAISGALIGGGTELVTLEVAAKGGLSFNEVAIILQEHDLPANFIKQIHTIDEYYELLELTKKGGFTIEQLSQICTYTKYPLEVVKMFKNVNESTVYFDQAGLYAQVVNGNISLIRNIDLTYESELAGKTVTNLERMRHGYAAIDPVTKQPFQLHHIGQTIDSPLAILTPFEHSSNNAILHDVKRRSGQGVHSLMTSSQWTKQKEDFWIALAELLTGAA